MKLYSRTFELEPTADGTRDPAQWSPVRQPCQRISWAVKVQTDVGLVDFARSIKSKVFVNKFTTEFAFQGKSTGRK